MTFATNRRGGFIPRALAVCIAASLCVGAFTSRANAQAAGTPQAVGGDMSRVGGFQPVRPLSAAPAASGTPPANQPQQQVQQQPQQPQQQQRAPSAQPGQPLQGPAPQQYPRNNAMPSPEVDLVNEALDRAAPLTPAQIKDLRRQIFERREAVGYDITGRPPAKATTGILPIDLSPGSTPPVVRIEVNQGSIVSFIDAAGKPWPVRVADNYNSKAMTASQFTEHQLSLGTTSPTAIKVSVAVALEGLPTAVTFTVISGERTVDSQMVFQIPQYRNGAPPEVGALSGQPALATNDLNNFLLRTPPKSAKPLKVEGVAGVMAWQISDSRMVIRSSNKVASGYFRGNQGVGDGTEVYEAPLSPQVSFFVGDRMVFATISGFTVGTFGGASK